MQCCVLLLPLRCCCRPLDVSTHVSRISRLFRDRLDGFPKLPDLGRQALVCSQGVDALAALMNGSLHEGALRVTSAEENAVEDQEDPAALGKNDGRQKDTKPKKDLQGCHEGHRCIIVFFDKAPDGVSPGRRFGLGPW